MIRTGGLTAAFDPERTTAAFSLYSSTFRQVESML